MITAKEHKEKRAKLIDQAQKFNDENKDADGHLSAENQEQFDKIFEGADEHLKSANRILKLEKAAASLNEVEPNIAQIDPMSRDAGHDGSDLATGGRIFLRYPRNQANGKPRYVIQKSGVRGSKTYMSAFESYLKGGTLSTEQFAALQSDNDTQAGFLVPSEQFATGILKDIDDILWIRQLATIHTVAEATSLGIRKRTTRASTFDWSTELQVSDEDQSLKYGKKVLHPHHATGLIKVSRDLLRRSMLGAEAEVRSELARDAGELMEDAYLTGDGNLKPLGVFVESDDGIGATRNVQAGNTATEFTADGLINAKYSLKEGYRNDASTRWLMHREALKIAVKLKDDEGRFLWLSGLTENEPDRLLGIAIAESERAPSTFTAGLFVAILGAWRHYAIADALDMEIQMLMELFAQTNEVGFLGRLKNDGLPQLEEAFARVQLGP